MLLALGFLLFLGVYFIPQQLKKPSDLVFSNDAYDYHHTAVHLARLGFYSLDGETPYLEREPGYSLFLALIYRVFGEGGRVAIYAVSGALYLLASLFFTRELRRKFPEGITVSVLATLLFFPSLFLALSLVYREVFTMALFLFFAGLFFWFEDSRKLWQALLMAFLLGFIVLTYIPFLFLPFVIGGLFIALGFPWKHAVLLVLIPMLFFGGWTMRNRLIEGGVVAGNQRMSGNIYMRAQKSAYLTPSGHFTCLYKEYVLRGFPPLCYMNSILHELGGRIERGEITLEESTRQSKKLLLLHPGGFFLGSIAEVLEHHFPFFDGSTRYNVIALIAYIFLYIGILCGLKEFWQRRFVLFLVLSAYAIVIFALTDATPRYHMPVLFCYIVLSVVGYHTLCSHFPSSYRRTMKRKA